MAALKQQNLQYGTYYSDQPHGVGGKATRFIIIGVIVAAVIGMTLTVISLFSGNARNDMTFLAVRENSLLTLANESQKSIRNADLATANSNATVLLTSDVVGIVADTGIKKLPDNLVKQEADTNTDDLKQAALLNKFDSTYRLLVLEKVDALIVQANTVREAVSGKESRDVIDKSIVNLKSIQKQFTEVTLE